MIIYINLKSISSIQMLASSFRNYRWRQREREGGRDGRREGRKGGKNEGCEKEK
jgi:predicted transposase YdaD